MNAKLDLEVKKAKRQSKQLSLNTTLEPKIALYKGYQIKLVKLSPYPVTTSRINPDDYEATMVITN